jgi:hypothetical protein
MQRNDRIKTIPKLFKCAEACRSYQNLSRCRINITKSINRDSVNLPFGKILVCEMLKFQGKYAEAEKNLTVFIKINRKYN